MIGGNKHAVLKSVVLRKGFHFLPLLKVWTAPLKIVPNPLYVVSLQSVEVLALV